MRLPADDRRRLRRGRRRRSAPGPRRGHPVRAPGRGQGGPDRPRRPRTRRLGQHRSPAGLPTARSHPAADVDRVGAAAGRRTPVVGGLLRDRDPGPPPRGRDRPAAAGSSSGPPTRRSPCWRATRWTPRVRSGRALRCGTAPSGSSRAPVSRWPLGIVTRRRRPVERWSGAPSPDAAAPVRGGTSAPCRRPRGHHGSTPWHEDTDAQDGLRWWTAFKLTRAAFGRRAGPVRSRGVETSVRAGCMWPISARSATTRLETSSGNRDRSRLQARSPVRWQRPRQHHTAVASGETLARQRRPPPSRRGPTTGRASTTPVGSGAAWPCRRNAASARHMAAVASPPLPRCSARDDPVMAEGDEVLDRPSCMEVIEVDVDVQCKPDGSPVRPIRANGTSSACSSLHAGVLHLNLHQDHPVDQRLADERGQLARRRCRRPHHQVVVGRACRPSCADHEVRCWRRGCRWSSAGRTSAMIRVRRLARARATSVPAEAEILHRLLDPRPGFAA